MKKALTAESLKKGIMQASPLSQTGCLEGLTLSAQLVCPKADCLFLHWNVL